MIKGDLLTQMLLYEDITITIPEIPLYKKLYHFSSWVNDDPRITAGVKHGLLNPISFHPTKTGHKVLTEILSPYIEKLLMKKSITISTGPQGAGVDTYGNIDDGDGC